MNKKIYITKKFESFREVRANKQHVCKHSGETINKGDIYWCSIKENFRPLVRLKYKPITRFDMSYISVFTSGGLTVWLTNKKHGTSKYLEDAKAFFPHEVDKITLNNSYTAHKCLDVECATKAQRTVVIQSKLTS